MEFIISRDHLLQALLHTGNAITRMSESTWKHFVFTFDKDAMTIRTTNGEIWISETVALDASPQEPRPIALYYQDILRAVKSLDQQPLRFEVGEYQVIVHHSLGSFRLTLYNRANELLSFKAPCPDAEAADGHQIDYEAPGLCSVLRNCSFAMAKDLLRPVMNGVYINLTEQFSDYVASDGHRLVRVRKRPVCSCDTATATSIILPASVVRILLKVLPATGDVTVEYQEKEKFVRNPQCRITIDGNLTLSFCPVDGRYPSYWQVIPDDYAFEMKIDRKALLKSVNRLSLFTDTSSDLLEMNIDERTLRLKAEDGDLEIEGEETLPCVSSPADGHSPIRLRIGVKATTLSQILNTLHAQEVTFRFIDEVRAVIVMPTIQPDTEEITMLLMPMLICDSTK